MSSGNGLHNNALKAKPTLPNLCIKIRKEKKRKEKRTQNTNMK
jgi:hypothetical protein